MRIILSITLILSLVSACSSGSSYKPLDKSLVNEMTAQYQRDKLDHPLDLKGYSRPQIITFCAQTVPADWVKRWPGFAYRKLQKYNKVSGDQEKALRQLLRLERNRASIYKFMLLLTDEQIKTVGY
ncbi:MAG: hypothetical protein OEZ36_00070 [Spirochaetota bacterium]|nr:hypothetical protein [Spirochaetota bacterium]